MSNAASMRQALLKVHRYVGLALAPLIVIIAATGSIITFYGALVLRASNTITSWIIALQVVAIWSLPLQIAVNLLGIVVAVIAASGVLIWWRKRKSRKPQSRARDVRDDFHARPSVRALAR